MKRLPGLVAARRRSYRVVVGAASSPRIAIVLAVALDFGAAVQAQENSDFDARARTITQRALLVDTHIDMPYALKDGWADVTEAAPDRNFDLPRALEGGLNVPFMSIYTPAELEAEGGAFDLANQLIDSVEALAGRKPGAFAMVHSTGDVATARAQGRLALALGMENGAPIEGDLDKLRHFSERGIRYVTLAHSLSNHISDSSYDENRPWGGLSPFGREVVAEMNRLGIMIDVSHLSDEAIYQVLDLSDVPVIASHSSARHFTPGWERNLSDELIRALAEKGGVIMINFGSTFLTREAREWHDAMDPQRDAWLEHTGYEQDGAEAREWEKTYRESHPFPYASVSDLADHFDHVVGLVGVGHVGIGSDYDGVGDSLPVGMKDVSTYPNLVAELLRRGYTEEDIVAILGGNLMRVWTAVEAHAAASD